MTGSHKVANYPHTYVSKIYVDLTTHNVTLEWIGESEQHLQSGPFKCSPGRGVVGKNCDDEETSKRDGSLCTPKGQFIVDGLAPSLKEDFTARHVTFFDIGRGIGLHYYPNVPDFAASHGCVRLKDEEIACLIQDNVIVNKTQVIVSGTWKKPPQQWASESSHALINV